MLKLAQFSTKLFKRTHADTQQAGVASHGGLVVFTPSESFSRYTYYTLEPY